jgi:hypothetical protein
MFADHKRRPVKATVATNMLRITVGVKVVLFGS